MGDFRWELSKQIVSRKEASICANYLRLGDDHSYLTDRGNVCDWERNVIKLNT